MMSKPSNETIVFGCGRLSSGAEEAQSRSLLRAALDLGISQFDIAPAYGDGDIERLISRYLPLKDGTVSICTKVGLPRGVQPSGLKTYIRRAIRPSYSFFKKWMPKESKNSRRHSVGNMNPTFLLESFRETLRLLNIEHVSSLLLHEPRNENVSSDQIRMLEFLLAEGLIEKFGVGTGGEFSSIPHIGTIAQFLYTPSLSIDNLGPFREVRLHGLFRYSEEPTSELARIASQVHSSKYTPKLAIVFSTKNIKSLRSNVALVREIIG